MAFVDWDGVAEEASDSPRAILAEVLALVEDIESVVIVFKRHDQSTGQYWAAPNGGSLEVIGLLQLAVVVEANRIIEA